MRYIIRESEYDSDNHPIICGYYIGDDCRLTYGRKYNYVLSVGGSYWSYIIDDLCKGMYVRSDLLVSAYQFRQLQIDKVLL